MASKRNTIQKSLVLDAVRDLHDHAAAEEVYQQVAVRHPSISRTTVYRNLNLLAESGEIRKVELPGEPERFDHVCSEHYHVRCSLCGKIADVDMACLSEQDLHIRDTHGFRITGHNISFRGICPACMEKQSLQQETEASMK